MNRVNMGPLPIHLTSTPPPSFCTRVTYNAASINETPSEAGPLPMQLPAASNEEAMWVATFFHLNFPTTFRGLVPVVPHKVRSRRLVDLWLQFHKVRGRTSAGSVLVSLQFHP